MLQVTGGYNRFLTRRSSNWSLPRTGGADVSATPTASSKTTRWARRTLLEPRQHAPVNNYNFMSVANNGSAAAPCQSGQQNTTACFDPTSEFSWHSRRAAPVHRRADLPAAVRQGQDRQSARQRRGRRMDARSGVQLQSGFPIGVSEQLGHQSAGQQFAAQRHGHAGRLQRRSGRVPGSADHATVVISDSFITQRQPERSATHRA